MTDTSSDLSYPCPDGSTIYVAIGDDDFHFSRCHYDGGRKYDTVMMKDYASRHECAVNGHELDNHMWEVDKDEAARLILDSVESLPDLTTAIIKKFGEIGPANDVIGIIEDYSANSSQ